MAAGLLRNLIVVGLLKILGPEPLGEGAFNRRHAYLSGILERDGWFVAGFILLGSFSLDL